METNIGADRLLPYATAANGSMVMWPVIGVMAALLFASFHFENPALIGFAIAVYVVGVFVAVGMQAKKTGVQPRFGSMPAELKRNLYRFWAASAILAIGGVALAFATNFLVAGVVIGIGIALIGMGYHRESRRIVASLLESA